MILSIYQYDEDVRRPRFEKHVHGEMSELERLRAFAQGAKGAQVALRALLQDSEVGENRQVGNEDREVEKRPTAVAGASDLVKPPNGEDVRRPRFEQHVHGVVSIAALAGFAAKEIPHKGFIGALAAQNDLGITGLGVLTVMAMVYVGSQAKVIYRRLTGKESS